MHPDGTANHEPDGIPPQSLPKSTQPRKIIDVEAIEVIPVVVAPLADVWDNDEVANPATPIRSTVKDSLPISEVRSVPIADDVPTLGDNWDILLDAISQDLEPEPELSPTNPARLDPSALEITDIKAEIDRLHITKAQLERQIADTQLSFGEIARSSIGELEQRRQKLQVSVEQLERRRDRIKAEINKKAAY